MNEINSLVVLFFISSSGGGNGRFWEGEMKKLPMEQI